MTLNESSTKKVSEMTVDEFKSVIHEVIAEDRKPGERHLRLCLLKKLMRQIKQADLDWASGVKDLYVPWDDLKSDLKS